MPGRGDDGELGAGESAREQLGAVVELATVAAAGDDEDRRIEAFQGGRRLSERIGDGGGGGGLALGDEGPSLRGGDPLAELRRGVRQEPCLEHHVDGGTDVARGEGRLLGLPGGGELVGDRDILDRRGAEQQASRAARASAATRSATAAP